MQVQAVVFDYGNVLSLPQPEQALVDMAAKLCLPFDALEKLYWEFRPGYDAGLTPGVRYWHEVASRGGCDMNDEIAQQMISMDNASWSRENKAMSEFARQVRAAGFRTAILSNMPKDFRDFLPVGVQWLPQFDHHTYSCELNVTKPDQRIYEHCIRGLRIEPENAVFIDDREINCEAASAIGMQSVLFRDTEQALKEAAALCGVSA